MILTVHVKTGAKENRIRAWRDAQTVIVDIKSPPVDGKANAELVAFLAQCLRVPKTSIEIKRGAGSRVKHVFLPDNVDITKMQ